MTKELPYVDLLEAMRVVVRLMPDGNSLAKIMTDDWIKRDYTRAGTLDDDPTMIRLYGQTWRDLWPKTLSTFAKAAKVLEVALPSGQVDGIGLPAKAEVRRKIERDEWSTLRVDLVNSLLDSPIGKRAEDFPPIRGVRVCTKDLRREAAAVIKTMEGKSTTAASETRATDELASALKVNPHLTKESARAVVSNFHISGAGFENRVWPAARKQAALPERAPAGRKSRTLNRGPNLIAEPISGS
jgi:hypothetical protein